MAFPITNFFLWILNHCAQGQDLLIHKKSIFFKITNDILVGKEDCSCQIDFFYLTKHAQYTKKVFFDLQKPTMNSKIGLGLI